MRLVKVSAPRGKAADIARLTFEQGLPSALKKEGDVLEP